MDERVKELKGSVSRDEFKYWHKQFLPSSFYACDVDLVLIAPDRILAILDFKNRHNNDTLTYAEIIAYNHLISFGIRVFVVESYWNRDEQFERFIIKEFLGGDPNRGSVDLKTVILIGSPEDFKAWEQGLRDEV